MFPPSGGGGGITSAAGTASGGAWSAAAKKSKILKRSEKPRVVLVRNDHGVMEYRRASGATGSDAGSDARSPQIIRTAGHRRNLGKRLLSKQQAAAAAAASAATTHPHNASGGNLASTQPEAQSGERIATFYFQIFQLFMVDFDKEGNGVVKTEAMSSPEAEAEQQHPPDVKCAGDPPIKTEATRFGESHSVKEEEEESAEPEEPEEPEEEDDDDDDDDEEEEEAEEVEEAEEAEANEEAEVEKMEEDEAEAVTAPPEVDEDEDAYIVRPRRCLRLQKEDPVLINESDSSAVGNDVGIFDVSIHI